GMQSAKEAAALFRTLADREPRRYTPDLCRCLKLLSDVQSDAGYSKLAISSIEECIQIETRLWSQEPRRFLPDRASDHFSLFRRYRSAPYTEKALIAIECSVACFRDLATDYPERYSVELGWALINLFACQIDLGLRGAAIKTAASSLRHLRTSKSPIPFASA